MIRLCLFSLLIFCCSGDMQQGFVSVKNEPKNINTVKQELKLYHSCSEPTCYAPQMERQASIAIQFMRDSVASAKTGEKLAIVLDIDETSLSNWTVEVKDDFAYVPADSNACIAAQCGTAIPSTLRIFHEAEKNHVAVFFITGRPESQRADTAANLKSQGYDKWEHLFLEPPDALQKQQQNNLSVAVYKSAERREIVSEGYRIILNVGDQFSDLEGDPEADHSVKVPNPFYFIP
jgi:predicted secreted acid phosphatase